MLQVREQVHPTIKGRRRFYKVVDVRPVPPAVVESHNNADAAAPPPQYEVTLDGYALKTPGRRPMQFESLGLAWGLATEWDAQVGKGGIEPSTMPLMGLVSTWLDQTAEGRSAVEKNVLKYLATDTCCYYAEPVSGYKCTLTVL
jgi:chaperone required for assembly of F1-ATPase